MITNSKEMIINGEGFVQDIKHVLSPNCDARPENISINLLVIHNISLPPNQYGGDYIEHFFTNRLNPSIDPYFQEIKKMKVSSHFVIYREGNLTQYVSCKKRAWHAGVSEWNGKKNCNDFSIGIELEGSDHIEYTKSQYEKLNQLIRCLKSYYDIENVVGHSDIAPGRKTDPGTSFKWKKIEF